MRRTPNRHFRAKVTTRRARGAAPLATYNGKRDFDRTQEPWGDLRPRPSGRAFVVQQHAASHMHFDFRLELGGVLVSWAVPKGPSLDPSIRRLALQTEDHPLSYRNFEGNIPKGEYGGGSVIVWDRGEWAPITDAHEGMSKGHLRFYLQGEKLKGEFSLVRTKRGQAEAGPKSSWLLLKHDDAHAEHGALGEVTERLPRSVISGRRVDEVALAPCPELATTKRARAAREGAVLKKPAPAAKKGRTPAPPPPLATVEPQLATLVDRPPPAGPWVYEVKFDGYRMLARLVGGKAELRSRNGLNWTRTFSRITAALGSLGVKSALLDGEVCHLDEQGRTSFQDLQNALPRGGDGEGVREQSQIVYYIFDVLFHDGIDVREEGLLARKQRLQTLLGEKPAPPLMFSGQVQADGREALKRACAAGLEGLIGKRTDSPYRAGRGRDWIKLKCRQRQEFIIVGWTAPEGSRAEFGSLLLAVRDGDRLVYRGKVGTGFNRESLADLSKRMARLAVPRSPLSPSPRLRDVTWIRPDLVCEVAYVELTRDGSLRHPTFQGLRVDKPVHDAVQETAAPARPVKPVTSAGRRATVHRSSSGAEVGGVQISHPERVMDSCSGVTKLDMARYHAQVVKWALPYASSRPISIVRCPHGDARACFFQKAKLPGLGDAVHRQKIAGHETIYVESLTGILELVQFNAVEFHGWGARAGDPRRPDWLVMDLDPGPSVSFTAVVEAAQRMKEALSRLGLKSFVKTTGGKGLHVIAPLDPVDNWAMVKSFTRSVTIAFAGSSPDHFVASMSKAKRVGKIFIDHLRNGQGATAILPYSPRARPGAPVAMPVAWKDLPKVDPREFTVRTVPALLAKRRKDPWAGFFACGQQLPATKPSRR